MILFLHPKIVTNFSRSKKRLQGQLLGALKKNKSKPKQNALTMYNKICSTVKAQWVRLNIKVSAT